MNDVEFLRDILPEKLSLALGKMDRHTLSRLFEIRLRRDKPVILCFTGGCAYLSSNGVPTACKSNDNVIMHSVDFDNFFMKLCGYSLYSNTDSLKKGYLTLANGSRVGVCMSAVTENGSIISVKDAVSLNIRIPREIKHCADSLCRTLFTDGLRSVIVFSGVSGGKTTLLRDIARNLSEQMYKVAVIDERNEIAAKRETEITADVGDNTDVLTSFPKVQGIEAAVRTLSPDVIILDEVANADEARSIASAFSCGVRFILSVHASTIAELKIKTAVKSLLKMNEFSNAVMIDGGFKYKIFDITDGEINESSRSIDDNNLVGNERSVSYKNQP